MSLRKQFSRLALASALLVGALSAGSILDKATGAFTLFVPQAPPQRALGDFDGDGRVDQALIQDAAGDRRISVQLSGSTEAVRLDVPVTGVIEGDIDHDGDLDLVAATPSGDVLIWLNDGHGRFTRQAPSRTRGLSGELVIIQTALANAIALGIRAPFVAPPARARTIVIVRTTRPPTGYLALDARSPFLPTLRGPPAFLI
jgi:hypothetical protein